MKKRQRTTITTYTVWKKEKFGHNKNIHMLAIWITWGITCNDDNIFITNCNGLTIERQLFDQLFFQFFAVFRTQLNHTLEAAIYFYAFFPLYLSFALFLVLSLALNWNISMDISPSSILLFFNCMISIWFDQKTCLTTIKIGEFSCITVDINYRVTVIACVRNCDRKKKLNKYWSIVVNRKCAKNKDYWEIRAKTWHITIFIPFFCHRRSIRGDVFYFSRNSQHDDNSNKNS